MARLFSGCGTALVTPFINGSVDYDALEKMVERQIDAGIDALIAAGTTGEPATMTWEEHISVIRCVAEVARHRVPVIAGAGSNSTKEAVDAAKKCSDIGADALLVVTPYYNKTSQQGLIAHFNAVADATELPVIVYNVPSRTGLNIMPKTLVEICRNKKVAAVKEANGDVPQALEKLRLCGSAVDFYSGNDDLAVPMMSCGFKGVISVVSNVMPEETTRMAHAALEGDFLTAGKLQLQLLPLINELFCETSPIPVKAALAAMNLCSEELRLPLVPMQPENRARLLSTMAELGLIRN